MDRTGFTKFTQHFRTIRPSSKLFYRTVFVFILLTRYPYRARPDSSSNSYTNPSLTDFSPASSFQRSFFSFTNAFHTQNSNSISGTRPSSPPQCLPSTVTLVLATSLALLVVLLLCTGHFGIDITCGRDIIIFSRQRLTPGLILICCWFSCSLEVARLLRCPIGGGIEKRVVRGVLRLSRLGS